jgi:hypothetical protein
VLYSEIKVEFCFDQHLLMNRLVCSRLHVPPDTRAGCQYYLYVCISHMTLKQTRNSLLYMNVCIFSDLCDYRDSSTELLELQHFAQPRLEVTNKWCHL